MCWEGIHYLNGFGRRAPRCEHGIQQQNRAAVNILWQLGVK
jgi:hypothetical protein